MFTQFTKLYFTLFHYVRAVMGRLEQCEGSFLFKETQLPNCLTFLDTHKSAGPDNIPTRLLKELSTELAPILTVMFQASLHQCCVPTEWKKFARVVPIYKKVITAYLTTIALYH